MRLTECVDDHHKNNHKNKMKIIIIFAQCNCQLVNRIAASARHIEICASYVRGGAFATDISPLQSWQGSSMHSLCIQHNSTVDATKMFVLYGQLIPLLQ